MQAPKLLIKEFNAYFNPFRFGYDSDFQPHSRHLHTTFRHKMWDTYKAFKGDTSVLSVHFKKESEDNETEFQGLRKFYTNDRLGVFDYCTLGLGRVIHFAFDRLWHLTDHLASKRRRAEAPWKKIGWGILQGLALIPTLIITIPHFVINGLVRSVTSALFAFIMSPLVAIAHSITEKVSSDKEEKILPVALRLFYRNEAEKVQTLTDEEIADFFRDNSLHTVRVVKTEIGKTRQATETGEEPSGDGEECIVVTFAYKLNGRPICCFFRTKPDNEGELSEYDSLLEINSSARRKGKGAAECNPCYKGIANIQAG